MGEEVTCVRGSIMRVMIRRVGFEVLMFLGWCVENVRFVGKCNYYVLRFLLKNLVGFVKVMHVLRVLAGRLK